MLMVGTYYITGSCEAGGAAQVLRERDRLPQGDQGAR